MAISPHRTRETFSRTDDRTDHKRRFWFLATRTRRLMTLGKDGKCSYYHDPIVAQISQKGANQLSRSDDSRPHEGHRSRSDLSHGWRDRTIFLEYSTRYDPGEAWLCNLWVHLLDLTAYLRAHSPRSERCQSRYTRIRSTRKVRKTPSCLPHRPGEGGYSIISQWTKWWLLSPIHPPQL